MKVNQNEEVDRGQLTRDAVNLLRGQLKPKGFINESVVEMPFHCPFHKDETPSMFINMKKGIYKCFSCGKKGSIESLYRELTSNNLYSDLGIKRDRFSRYASNRFIQFDTSDSNRTEKVYVNIDWNDIVPYTSCEESYDYVYNRGISEEVAKKYKFGYAELTRINTTTFRNRLIIPIYEGNRLISVEGRRINSTEKPKVLYPKNCSVDTLFDLDNLDRHQTLYACEGLMDLCVLKSSGTLQNSTSVFGASITKRQKELFREFDKVVYIPDLDEAGKKTMINLKESQLDNIYYLLLPRSINGCTIKDIGDLPKANIDVEYLEKRKWLKYIKPISSFNEEYFSKYIL